MMHDILKIKQGKEQNAIDKIEKCKSVINTTKEKLRKQENELEEYKQWRIQEETSIYDSIFNKSVKQRQLDEVKHEIAELRKKDVILLEAVNKTAAKLEQAKEDLVIAKKEYKKASKTTEKFQEIVNVLDHEQLLEDRILEDHEMEEFQIKNE